MEKIFKWIYSPNGNCPIQAEGYFLGYFFILEQDIIL